MTHALQEEIHMAFRSRRFLKFLCDHRSHNHNLPCFRFTDPWLKSKGNMCRKHSNSCFTKCS